MPLKSALSGISLAVLISVSAHAAEPLQPRAEVSVKGGTDRSLLTTEFWAPLAQDKNRVLYGDIRLMGDNDENREGNLGIGYRQVVDDYVVGAHGWIDRRRTQNNSTFHQLTFGVERLGHIVDARANIYVPLNGTRSVTTPNIGAASPYLAGNGIFYDTNGAIVETPQYGIDGEVGYRIPVFQKQVDALRVLGGGYHFFREDTDNVTGIRLRTEAQINAAFSVGARLQHDAPRGSQGFLEATLKFPFSAKKLYQTDYLRSRLDESPERDVDIVTDSKMDTGLRKEIISTTSGQRQRVINVDNSNTNAGDGTKENPFNTLKAAEAALQDNDILYVNHGTGTTQGMDLGINITKANVSLIGSGSDFVYDAGKFSSYSRIKPTTGTLIAAATAAPIITNTDAFVEDGSNSVFSYTGNGIFITGSNALVTGVNIQNASAAGIYVLSEQTGISLGNFTLSNSQIGNSQNGRGVSVSARNSGIFNDILISETVSNNNLGTAGRGIEVRATDTSRINDIQISNNTTLGNANNGIFVEARNGSQHNNVFINNNTSSNNSRGIYTIATTNSQIENITITDNTVNNNSNIGIYVYSLTDSLIKNVSTTYNQISNNISYGIDILAAGNSTINNAVTTHNTLNGNTSGIISYVQTDGHMDNVIIDSNTTSNHSVYGIYAHVNGTGSINNIHIHDNINNIAATGIGAVLSGGSAGNISIQNNISRNNAGAGITVTAQANSATIDNVQVINNLSENNTTTSGRGLYILSSTSGSIMNNITVCDNIFRNNAHHALYAYALTGGIMNDLTITNNTISSSGVGGIITTASNGSQINDLIITSNNVSGSGTYGIHSYAVTNSTIGDTVISGNTITTSTNYALFSYAQLSSTMNNLTIDNNNVFNNTSFGIYLQASSLSTAGNVSMTNNSSQNNLNGLYIQTNNAQINSLVVSDNTTTANRQLGIGIHSLANGLISTTTLSNNIANGNLTTGINLLANGGRMNAATLIDNTALNNTQYGFYLHAQSATSALDNLSMERNNSIGNTSHGLYIQKSAAAATLNIDLGGGAFGSLGQNNISGNTANDVNLNYTGGGSVIARNNYWGGGALTRVTVNVGTSIDSTAFLTTTP